MKTLHRKKLKTNTLVGNLGTKDSVEDCISLKPTPDMIKRNIWDISTKYIFIFVLIEIILDFEIKYYKIR